MATVKNQLQILTLRALAEHPLSGYDLIKEIHNQTGHWKPSYGSIYPLLKELHAKKLVAVKNDGRRKVYSLTVAGKKTTADLLESKEETMQMMAKHMKMMECLCTDSEKKFFHLFQERIKNNEPIFGSVSEEVDQIQKVMIELITSGRLEQNKQEVKKILQSSVKRLKSI